MAKKPIDTLVFVRRAQAILSAMSDCSRTMKYDSSEGSRFRNVGRWIGEMEKPVWQCCLSCQPESVYIGNFASIATSFLAAKKAMSRIREPKSEEMKSMDRLGKAIEACRITVEDLPDGFRFLLGIED